MSTLQNLNAVPCYEGYLKTLQILAMNTNYPFGPYPIFFTSGQCNNSAAPDFPNYNIPMSCNANPDPDQIMAEDNCMRIITDKDFNPYDDKTIDPQKVNVLPFFYQTINGIKEVTINSNDSYFSGNIFPAEQDSNKNYIHKLLISVYVPPTYRIIFYAKDPRTTPKSQAFPYLELSPGTLIVNSCFSKLSLSESIQKANPKYAPDKPEFGPEFFDISTFLYSSVENDCTPENLFHIAPFFVIHEVKTFESVLIDMCVNNTPYNIGSSANSLNEVWKPQSQACDNFIKIKCLNAKYKNTPMCECFNQQRDLDNEYGEKLKVPVCCFGKSKDGDMKKACPFNSEAYKTSNMLRHCCSFAECQQVVQQSQALKDKNASTGQIQCVGNLVEFPKFTPTPTVTQITTTLVIKDIKEEIPDWVFYFMIFTAVFVIFAVIFYSFVENEDPEMEKLNEITKDVRGDKVLTHPNQLWDIL